MKIWLQLLKKDQKDLLNSLILEIRFILFICLINSFFLSCMHVLFLNKKIEKQFFFILFFLFFTISPLWYAHEMFCWKRIRLRKFLIKILQILSYENFLDRKTGIEKKMELMYIDKYYIIIISKTILNY